MRASVPLVLVVLGLWAQPARAQVTEYYHLDGIGSVRAVTGQAGQVVERHDYLPFGEEWCGSVVCGSDAQAGGQAKKFTGKERDAETDLDSFGARYYGSRIGRFTSIDPICTWGENLVDPQRWNRYAYVRGNPLRYVDPDGRTLTLPGSPGNQRRVEAIANSGLFGQELSIAPDGRATLKSNGQAGPPTAEQSAMADVLQAIISDKADTRITLSNHSHATLVGDFNSQDIDLGDMAAFGRGPASTQAGKFGHEITEQYVKQVKGGHDYDAAHAAATAIENGISGWERGRTASWIGRSLTGTAYETYDRKDATILTTIQVLNGNITSISRDCVGAGCR